MPSQLRTEQFGGADFVTNFFTVNKVVLGKKELKAKNSCHVNREREGS